MKISIENHPIEAKYLSFPTMSLSSNKEEALSRGVTLVTVEYGIQEFADMFEKEYAKLIVELTDDLKFENPNKAELAVLNTPDLRSFLGGSQEDINEVVRIYLWDDIKAKSFLGSGAEILWAVYDSPVTQVVSDQVVIQVHAYKCQ